MAERPIEPVIAAAAEALGESNTSWVVLRDEPLDHRVPARVRLVEIGFPAGATPRAGGARPRSRVQEIVVKWEFGAEAGEAAVLEALAGSDLPLPRVLSVEQRDNGSLLALSRLPGQPLSTTLQSAGANWELAAAATAMAQLLVRIHALDWRAVVPWMSNPGGDETQQVLGQLQGRWADWEERIRQAPADQTPLYNQTLDWLRRHLPTKASLCLCHGDYTPANLLSTGVEVSGVVDWDRALVTDPAWDVALLPLAVSRTGRDAEAATRFIQTFLGAYADASSRSLENLPFFIVARLLDGALEEQTRADDDANDPAAPGLDDYLSALPGAIAHNGQFPW